MKRKALVISLAVVAALAIIFCAVLLFILLHRPQDNRSVLAFNYNDTMTGIPMQNANGEDTDSFPQSDKYSFVLYVSNGCESCQRVLQSFDRLNRIFGSEMNIFVVWEGTRPDNLIAKYKIPENDNYSLNSKTMIATATPTCFLLTPEQKMLFSDSDLGVVADKILQDNVLNPQALMENASAYIRESLFPANEKQPLLLCFFMKGCKDCEAAEAVLKDDSISSAFKIEKLYYDRDAGLENDGETDSYNLLAKVFQVDWYPSFWIWKDGTYHLIGEVPVAELKDKLLS